MTLKVDSSKWSNDSVVLKQLQDILGTNNFGFYSTITTFHRSSEQDVDKRIDIGKIKTLMRLFDGRKHPDYSNSANFTPEMLSTALKTQIRKLSSTDRIRKESEVQLIVYFILWTNKNVSEVKLEKSLDRTIYIDNPKQKTKICSNGMCSGSADVVYHSTRNYCVELKWLSDTDFDFDEDDVLMSELLKTSHTSLLYKYREVDQLKIQDVLDFTTVQAASYQWPVDSEGKTQLFVGIVVANIFSGNVNDSEVLCKTRLFSQKVSKMYEYCLRFQLIPKRQKDIDEGKIKNQDYGAGSMVNLRSYNVAAKATSLDVNAFHPEEFSRAQLQELYDWIDFKKEFSKSLVKAVKKAITDGYIIVGEKL